MSQDQNDGSISKSKTKEPLNQHIHNESRRMMYIFQEVFKLCLYVFQRLGCRFFIHILG